MKAAKKQAIRIFRFNNWKYSKALLVDAGTVKNFPGYFFEEEEHATDFYELIFWQSGTGYLMLDDRKIQLAPGLLIFIAPYRKRRWFVNRKTVQCRLLLFREEFVSDFLKNALFLCELPFFYSHYPHHLVPHTGDWRALTSLLQEVIAAVRQQHPGNDTLVQCQVVYLLQLASRAYQKQHKISMAGKGQGLAHQFRYLLELSPHADHGVEYYAAQLKTTRVTLNKYCNSIFAVNAGALVRQRLVFEIKSGLLYSNRTVNEIADILGFKEPGNLSRFFKQHTGCTPSGYRKLFQGGLYFG